MEKIASDLKLADSKQSSLGKAYESLHAQASSFLVLGLQWKDLEEHFHSTRNSLQTRFQELQVRENQIGDQVKKLEALESKTRYKAGKLREIAKMVGEKQKEVDNGKSHLHSLKSLIQENSEELEIKEKRFSEVEVLLRNTEREFEIKERRCSEVAKLLREKEKLLKERTKKLSRVENQIEERAKEVESKEKEVKVVQGVLDKYCDDIELKERRLRDIEGSIEKQKKEFDLKGEQVKSAQRLIEECDKELKLKKGEMKSIQDSMLSYSDKIKSKEKLIGAMDLQIKDFWLHKKAMEEWCCNLDLKQRELEGWVEKLESTEKQFEPKVEELHLIDKRLNDCLNEAQLKLERHFHSLNELRQEHQKHFDSLEKSVQERSHELEMKERRLEEKVKELDLIQQQLGSVSKATGEQIKSKEKASILHSLVKSKQLEHNPTNNIAVPSSTSKEFSINRDGRVLQLIMSDHLKRTDLLGTEISALLQDSPDPAGLVLDAIQGFYPTNLTVVSNELDLDLRVIRQSCIILLQELKRLSPRINSQAREEAMKLASEWKTKMTVATENRLEVLGFLQLVTTYELTSMYDAKELQSLLAIVAQPEQATELFQVLGITDKAHGKLFLLLLFISEFLILDGFLHYFSCLYRLFITQ